MIEFARYVATAPGLGGCFHQAIDAWGKLRVSDPGWRIAVGVMGPNPYNDHRHLHAWLERGGVVVSTASGKTYMRKEFYSLFDIEPQTVRLMNPRALRNRPINREAVKVLLNLWGQPWHVTPEGGVMPGKGPR